MLEKGRKIKKLKIYLDTSVISYLEASDAIEKQEDTRKLWQAIQSGKFDVFISPVVVIELDNCNEPKRSVLAQQLQKISYTMLEQTDEVLELATLYLEAGILREKSYRDCQHIAYACVHNCDMIVSWNFKHLVNIKTISGVKSVNALAGYKEMPIYSPTMLIEGGVDDDL
jgi:predicted nucleic acid-binding protein